MCEQFGVLDKSAIVFHAADLTNRTRHRLPTLASLTAMHFLICEYFMKRVLSGLTWLLIFLSNGVTTLTEGRSGARNTLSLYLIELEYFETLIQRRLTKS